MSSIKDKLKSKIKSRMQQPQTMESFDQNAVNVTIAQGKNQLSEIRLQCSWNSKNNMKNPRLKCRWYNRTENNLQEISGVDDENYQPSILDVGSIIEITCQPELPGISYQGMPIQLKSHPITLASETENQSTHLVAQGKAKFFIELKEAKIKGRSIAHGCDSVIKIEGYKMVVCQMKFGQLNDDVIKQCAIDELFPQIAINRRNSREITLRFGEQQSCIINFKNHQIRDVFCLVNRLMVAKLNVVKSIEAPIENVSPQDIERTPTKAKDPEGQFTSAEKVERERSEQLTLTPKQQTKVDSVVFPKQAPKAQTASKPSAADILQLTNLKLQIKQIQAANMKLTKQLEAEKDKNYNLQNKIAQINERMQNASKNYFQLQRQLKNSQEQFINFKRNAQQKVEKDNGKDEELLYYRNQIKIMSTQRDRMANTIEQLTKTNQNLLQQVQNYRKIYNAQQQHKSFNQLENQMKALKQMNYQLKMKYEYSLEQKDKIEEDLKNSRNIIQQIEAQKKHIQKRYESLTNQLSSPTLSMSKLSDNKSNGESSLSNSYVFQEMPPLDRRQSSKSSFASQFDHRQRQILQLKKQIKDLAEENGYVRSLLHKQKKPSSKTQLKLELFEVKKIVNRLSEAMIQKDMCINNLKEINKELNKKNADLLSASSALVRSSV